MNLCGLDVALNSSYVYLTKEADMNTLNLVGVALMSAFGGYIAGVPLGMFLDEDSLYL